MKNNREIKFRAWDKNSNRFVSVGRYYDIDNDGVMYPTHLVDDDVLDLELMQYTGLKDKHGQDIYEGDIIITTSLFDDSFKQEVKWLCDKHKRYNVDGYLEHEIIGNIYENSELLNETAKTNA